TNPVFVSPVTGSHSGSDVTLTLLASPIGSVTFAGTETACGTVADLVPLLTGTLTRVRTSYCGDGTVDAGEACDDADFVDDDLCNDACTTTCGNGVLDPGEGCDDGNRIDGDSCTAHCTPAACGNGIPEPGEECDDGNDVNGDGCSTTCQTNVCGNGI